MTPFELALEQELTVERQRFDSKWLFVWHNINIKNRLVDVDDFKGGRIRVGGSSFEGQIQEIYWRTIGRYLQQKIHEIFRHWDVETREYSNAKRLSSLDATANCLRRFAATIVRSATETDRALRGKGDPKSVNPYPRASGPHTTANAEIFRLVEAHKQLIGEDTIAAPASLFKKLEKWYSQNKALAWLIGLSVGALLAIVKLL